MAAMASGLGLSCIGSSAPTVLAPPPEPQSLVSTAGCEVEPPDAVAHGLHAADGIGRQRQFSLHVTPGYDRHHPVALVFMFHGANGRLTDPLGPALRDAITAAGDEAVVVVPQGLPFARFGVGWDQSCRGPDMPFYDAMIRAVSSRYCIDPKRIFATGFSWGADMVDALACCRGETLRGVAPFSGDETDYNLACPSQRAPAARLRYGSAQGAAGDGAYTLAQFRAATDFFRQAQSCAADSDAVEPSPCRAFRTCRQPVLECALPALGHTGPDAAEIAATWKFWRDLR